MSVGSLALGNGRMDRLPDVLGEENMINCIDVDKMCTRLALLLGGIYASIKIMLGFTSSCYTLLMLQEKPSAVITKMKLNPYIPQTFQKHAPETSLLSHFQILPANLPTS